MGFGTGKISRERPVPAKCDSGGVAEPITLGARREFVPVPM